MELKQKRRKIKYQTRSLFKLKQTNKNQKKKKRKSEKIQEDISIYTQFTD